MTKRSLFLSVAAGLLASAVLATPSRAGTEFLTTITYSGANPLLTDIDVFYPTATGTISGLTNLSPSSGVTASISGTNEVVLAISPASAAGTISFDLAATGSIPSTVDLEEVFGTNSSGSVTIGYSIADASVPEPSSIALLGIGVTGFLAFRRLFKRNSVA
jgi:PEP-CTERM motif